ncbi:glycoside hydrolase family 72 protein [Rostrohypoxylon terebratum]|nr:glycoside hydrolase family 72 protein [Rostrohypoxylon terebratum]
MAPKSRSARSTRPARPMPIIPVTIRGKFFWQNEKRFLINGVVYTLFQELPEMVDPLTDDHLNELERSIPLLTELGVNTIFVYHIDSTKNHDTAMEMLSEVGIYVLPCIAPPYDESKIITLDDLHTPSILGYCFRCVDSMMKYPNTLGFVSSTGQIDDVSKTVVAPSIRAVVRDVKVYIRLVSTKKRMRTLPVGVFIPDQRSLLKLQYEYFTSAPEVCAVDFIGFNEFSYVGDSPMMYSSYYDLINIFSTSPVPAFFSMYGNKAISPRPFHETQALYGDFRMLSTFSGGIVFEFFQSSLGFGLVQRTARRKSRRVQVRLTRLEDFNNLRDMLKSSFMNLPPIISNRLISEPVGIRPQAPRRCNMWLAGLNLPRSPVCWAKVEEDIDDSEWVDLGKDAMENAVEDLGKKFKKWLNFR